jgi:hypothetical protein
MIVGAAVAGLAAFSAPQDAAARHGGVHRGAGHAAVAHARILRPWSLQLQRRYSGLYHYGYTPGFTPPWVYAPVAATPYYAADPNVSVCYRSPHVKMRKGKRARRAWVCN